MVDGSFGGWESPNRWGYIINMSPQDAYMFVVLGGDYAFQYFTNKEAD